jgi:hypothetical protein
MEMTILPLPSPGSSSTSGLHAGHRDLLPPPPLHAPPPGRDRVLTKAARSAQPPAARRTRQPAPCMPLALQQWLRLVCAKGEVGSRRCGHLGGRPRGHGTATRDRCARGRALLGAGGRQASEGVSSGAPRPHMAVRVELRGQPWRRASSSATDHGGGEQEGVNGRPLRSPSGPHWAGRRRPRPCYVNADFRLCCTAVPAGVSERRSLRHWRPAADKELAGGAFPGCTPLEMRLGREVTGRRPSARCPAATRALGDGRQREKGEGRKKKLVGP